MSKPSLSVIVPVYNSEKYLHRCIDSILNQSYTDFELILVNDGSTDKSGDICEQYVKKYSNIQVIHKENGGQSTARNKGIIASQGRLISFIDSDDFIHPQMFEILVKALNETGADVSVCQYDRCDDTSTDYFVEYDDFDTKVVQSQEIINYYWEYTQGIYGMAPWNKIYKREIFENNLFEEGIIYEDHYIIPSILIRSKSISFVDCHLYYYYQSENSTIRSSFSVKNMDAFYVWTNSILPFLYKYSTKENIDIAENYYIDEYLHAIFTIKRLQIGEKIPENKKYSKLCKKLIIKQKKISVKNSGKLASLIYILFIINSNLPYYIGSTALKRYFNCFYKL